MQYNVNVRIILLHYIYGFLKKKNQKLVLSTNKMLYLQKQPLVGTL